MAVPSAPASRAPATTMGNSLRFRDSLRVLAQKASSLTVMVISLIDAGVGLKPDLRIRKWFIAGNSGQLFYPYLQWSAAFTFMPVPAGNATALNAHTLFNAGECCPLA